jgi:hypothetical protein
MKILTSLYLGAENTFMSCDWYSSLLPGGLLDIALEERWLLNELPLPLPRDDRCWLMLTGRGIAP